ncbi:MAG: hypothetical protein ACNA7K_02840 [Acholeplasmataceae bacterium]
MKPKDILFFGLFICLAALMLLIIYLDEPKKDFVIITVDTEHIYYFERDTHIKVMFYVNDPHSPFYEKDYYEQVILKDASETIILDVELDDVIKNHEEAYLNQTYTQVVLYITMPYVASNLFIENLEIDITLSSGLSVSLPLGKLSIGYEPGVTLETLDWRGLYGFKSETKVTPRIHTVHVTYHELSKEIKEIEIGHLENITFHHQSGELIITIPYDDALLYEFPIKIMYTDDDIDIIDRFLYMKNYQILVESGPLLYVTPLN